jgi:hypothetical protein
MSAKVARHLVSSRYGPQPIPVNLPLFTSIGFAHSDFAAKPALAAWDEQFARSWTGR